MFMSGSAASGDVPQKDDLWAYDVERAFDGERILEGGALVMVRGSRIVAVQPSGSCVPAGCTVTRYQSATVLPGLIDTHVHLCADGSRGALVRDSHRTVPERESVVREALRQQLRSGVTSVRDLGDHRWTVLERAGREDEPAVVASGPPITTPGGHCAAMGGGAHGSQALKRAVSERAQRHADVVKIIVSGGAMTAGSDLLSMQYSPQDLSLVVREAHRVGLPVAAHAHSLEAVQACVLAGVDGIEHCTCLTERGLLTPPDLIAALAAANIHVGPTLGRVPGSLPSPQAVQVMRRTGLSVAGRLAQVARLHRGGVAIISGSDAGIHPGKPHGVLPHAVAEIVAAGLPVADALASATSIAARACGLDQRTGFLRAGLRADLLVVDGNPGVNIADLTRVRAIVLRGRQIPLTGTSRPPQS
jgi:imidazolonepropionase-like amidohydrolase